MQRDRQISNKIANHNEMPVDFVRLMHPLHNKRPIVVNMTVCGPRHIAHRSLLRLIHYVRMLC